MDQSTESNQQSARVEGDLSTAPPASSENRVHFDPNDSHRSALNVHHPNSSDDNPNQSSDGERDPFNDNNTDVGALTAPSTSSEWTKQRHGRNTNSGDAEVGASYVNAIAPDINRRNYLGLDRVSAVWRRNQARQERAARRAGKRGQQEQGQDDDVNGNSGGREVQTSQDQDQEGQNHQGFSEERTVSASCSHTAQTSAPEVLISAHLVEDDVGVVVEAKRVNFFERNWKPIGIGMCLLLVIVTVAPLVFLLPANKESPPKEAKVGEAMKVEVVDPKSCDVCINRTAYKIKVITTANFNVDAFSAARRTAENMKLDIDRQIYPHGKYQDTDMADEIRSSVESDSGVDALIVSIPNQTVENAVKFAADSKMPIFGMGSGFERAKDFVKSEPEQVLFFTSMDDRLGGEMAASYFLQQLKFAEKDAAMFVPKPSIIPKKFTRALFISPPPTKNSVYQIRFEGYRDRLIEASNNTIQVDQIHIDPTSDGFLPELVSLCTYQSVLIGSGSLVPSVMMYSNLLLDYSCDHTKMGTFFDSSDDILYKLVQRGELEFVIDQYEQLQAWALVVLAALYVTTGLALIPLEDSDGIYSPGPVLFTDKNLTKYSTRTIDRTNVTIGGVVHGTKDEKFWDTVVEAAKQGAHDMKVELKFDLFEPHENITVLYQKMSTEVNRLCESGIDGLFVTLSDDAVVDAVRNCTELNPSIKILSINTGYGRSKELNLIHHIGMVEKDAGYDAGKKMVSKATLSKTLCWNEVQELASRTNRCKGFGKAMSEAGIEYLGQIGVPDGEGGIATSTEITVGDEYGDWDGVGILLTHSAQLSVALELQKDHPKLVLGTFDLDSNVYENLKAGNVLFGVDQQQYLQGYLPIPILAHAVTTQESFLNHLLKSGPKFVISPPAADEAECERRNFPVCGMEDSIDNPTSAPTGSERPTASIQPSFLPTMEPSTSQRPSVSPTFDTRPTLQLVQARGHVRCGLRQEVVQSRVDLCRSVAAALFGTPDSYEQVLVTPSTRFQLLNTRAVDILIYGDTITLERQVSERTTGASFSFSSPYYFDGMAYLGNQTFVACAEEQRRYDECTSLRICVLQGSTGYDFVQFSFPPEFWFVGSSLEETKEMLLNGTCNVISSDHSVLLNVVKLGDESLEEQFLGNNLTTKEPLAIVTRTNDREFSDMINWVVNALFYGEEQGLRNNSTLCRNYTSLTSFVSDLNFLNAVHCVGNYGDILFGGDQSNRGMNQINAGNTGMLYSIPFGRLELDKNDLGKTNDLFTKGDTQLDIIRSKGSLNCGVIAPVSSDTEATEMDKIAGMNVDYCRTLAAALFHGNFGAVKILTFSENLNSAFDALNNKTIDILAGEEIDRNYDFERPSLIGGFHFSVPYFYGNQTASDDVSFFSLATRDDDALFSSFVDCIVMATVYAQENEINKEKSTTMPLMTLFGSDYKWALRDSIAYSGSYDQIYEKNFVDVAKQDRGRNILNDISGPQIHSFPGIVTLDR